MTKPYRGKSNVDIRESTPDWEPFHAPVAAEGAPNVLVIVWDDVGGLTHGCSTSRGGLGG